MVKPCKFKIGDVIKPIEGRQSSNYHRFYGNLQIKITDIRYSHYNNRYELVVTILNGFTKYDGHSQYSKGNKITMYDDAFELAKPKENYAIF
jgi:hypothetical protein